MASRGTKATAGSMPDTAEWELVRQKEARPARASPWDRRASKTLFDEVLRRADIKLEDEAEAPDFEGHFSASPLLVSRWQRLLRALHRDALQELAYGRTFLFLPVLLGLGAIWWFTRPHDLPRLPVFLTFCAAGLVWLRVRYRHPVLAAVCGIATLGLAGMLLADVQTARLDTIIIDSAVTTVVRGKVVSVEPNADGNQRYVIALHQTRFPSLKRMPQQVALLARGAHVPFNPGDWIEGRARLSPPSGPALPGLNDFAFASYFAGTGAIGYFYQPPKSFMPGPEIAPPDFWEQAGIRLDETTQELRNGISDRIRAIVPGDAGAFAVAIVTGERRGLSEEANNDLRVSGLAHIISISGLHMALAGGLFFVGIRRLLSLVPGMAEARSIKKIAAAGAIATTTGYFLISGYDIAAQRAYLMMVIMLSAAFFDRPVLSLRNAALAAILVIILSPSQVMGPSLQMSFAATFALIAGFDLWRQRPRLPPILPAIPALTVLKPFMTLVSGILMTSALGGFSTAMFSAAHFHRVGLHGLEANLLAAPLMSMLVMPAAMIGVLLMPFGLDQWPIQLMGLGLEGVLMIASKVASWGAGFTFGRFEWWFLPVSATGLLILTLMKTRLRLIGVAMMLTAFGYEAIKTDPPLPDLAITEDGQLFALFRTDDRHVLTVATNKKRPPGFVFNQWRSVLDIADPIAPEILPKLASVEMEKDQQGVGQTTRDGKIKTKTGGQKAKGREPVEPQQAMAEMMAAKEKADKKPDLFHCRTDAFCLARLSNGWTVSLVQNRDYSEAACALSDLIVSTEASRDAVCKAPMASTASSENTGTTDIRDATEDGTGLDVESERMMADGDVLASDNSSPSVRSQTINRTQAGGTSAASASPAPRQGVELPMDSQVSDGASNSARSSTPLIEPSETVAFLQTEKAANAAPTLSRPPKVLTRNDLRRFGAMEITLGDPATRTLHIVTAFQNQYRPWTRHRYFDWRSNRYDRPDGRTHANVPSAANDDIQSGAGDVSEVSDNDE
ncbi:ComEC family competence protein [Agrobacterium vitis]|uniref:ComEC/Rec2 family competence protein n=1 Tax=Agrobacterium vitis TaxID=373 RepID=UPI001F22CDF6|nr:ComEC/Rec2 family competence protein [Agrobacterium vitis]MCF1468347.1 ComEC family competence protein [Agrobacterium vitis]